MNIVIEARALSVSRGIKTYVVELLKHLKQLDTNNSYTVVYDNVRHRGTVPDTTEQVVPLQHELLLPLWLNVQLPHALKRLQPDLVHFTKAAVPYKKIAPTVATIYDVIPLLFPIGQTTIKRWYWPRTLHHTAHASDHILTISETSKKDIVAHLGIATNNVTATPLGVDATHFYPRSPDEVSTVVSKLHLPQPYILSVSTFEPRKNIPLLVRSFAAIASHIPHHLVLVGNRGPFAAQIVQQIEKAGISDRVHILESIAYPDLPALFSGCELFVWPSIYEGWGLPPLEALACGVPTIVSNGGALPEVVGSAGTVVRFSTDTIAERLHDKQFEEALAKVMGEALSDHNQQENIQKTSVAHARQFTWQRTAQLTLKTYQQVLVGVKS